MTDAEPSSVDLFRTFQKNVRMQTDKVIYTGEKLAETVGAELTSS